MDNDKIWENIDKKYLDKMIADMSIAMPFLNFEPPKKWNWFERTFCPHIIQHINYIEKKLPIKKVKWNRYK